MCARVRSVCLCVCVCVCVCLRVSECARVYLCIDVDLTRYFDHHSVVLLTLLLVVAGV